jgi:preprotein translocase subunit SecA
MGDPEMAKEMQGPILNLTSAQTGNAQAILELFRALLLSDAAYVARLKRHYALFREKVDRAEASKSRRNRQPSIRSQAAEAGRLHQKTSAPSKLRAGDRVGRNDPCPCGSGRKFKVCCMT